MTDSEISQLIYYISCDAQYKDTLTISKKTAIGLCEYFNRQKAEIENYSHNVRKMTDSIYKYQKEIEQLKEDNEILSSCVKQSFLIRVDGKSPLSNLKAEAYKEFAERLNEKVEKARQKYQRLCKEQGEEEDEAMNIHFRGIINLVNNLLKEKVGEDK